MSDGGSAPATPGGQIPAEAVSAATEAAAKVHDKWYHSSPPVNRACAEAALTAAAPHIAAAEREACAQLAEQESDEIGQQIADLIRARP